MIVPTMDLAVRANARVLDLDLKTVLESVKLGLLDSALHAPLAGFGDVDLYPEPHQQLAVLCSRLLLNRPFLDGNKRTAFLLVLEGVRLNDIDLRFSDQTAVAEWIDGLAAGTRTEDSFADYLLTCIRR